MHVPAKNVKPLKLLVLGRRVCKYDRQRCSEKLESLIPHDNYNQIIRVGSFLIPVPPKNAKPLKLLLEGGVEKGM